MNHPKFLCIGARKAGTTWLWFNLRSHPRVWLTPQKEIHYFDRRPPSLAERLFGRRYQAFRALDAHGREVPSSTISHPSGDTSIRSTPPTSGTYFVTAEGVCESGGPDAGGPYGISLKAR